MPRALLLLSMLLLSAPSSAPAGDGVTLTIPVSNLRHVGQGELVVLLYREVARIPFDPSTAFLRTSAKVTGATLTVTLPAVPPGDYALSLCHDLDGDGELRTNFLGIPREDVAISNGAKGGPAGGPKWEVAAFAVGSEDQTVTPLSMSHMAKD
ncbi:MAG: DUF2141 domain-containing protein [Proteobacteria bacterium]|nr:DUF2141 domain-containing protein [Pseudomonadota bacterium]